MSLPIYFGKDQIEKLENGWRPSSVEMVKKNGQWYAHITIEKWIKFKEPKTVIGIDVGEVNFASCIAIPINNQEEYKKGYIERGEEIKRIRGLYGHIRRSLGRKKLIKKVKEIGQKENRKVNQEVHIVANRIIEYAKGFENPIISMEDLTNIRYNFDASKKLNKRFHSLPFYKLRKYIEYKANSEGIDVQFIEPYDTSKTCHICGNVSHIYGREYRCKVCGMVYNRDLNASINIAYVLMRDMGWRRCEPLGPTNENTGGKHDLNVGSS
jgi:IS605 OrfB family transposase